MRSTRAEKPDPRGLIQPPKWPASKPRSLRLGDPSKAIPTTVPLLQTTRPGKTYSDRVATSETCTTVRRTPFGIRATTAIPPAETLRSWPGRKPPGTVRWTGSGSSSR